jgi:hypothetical protein
MPSRVSGSAGDRNRTASLKTRRKRFLDFADGERTSALRYIQWESA